ncbi:MAG: MOSC domain-containing protein [Pseudomonadota bacterium]
MPGGTVVSVSSSGSHRFSKTRRDRIRLLAGIGVAGDSHAGHRVQHRSRVRVDPDQPNLRQVHLFGVEALEALKRAGFPVEPAVLGENITTRGVDLVALPQGTRLVFASGGRIEVTGLRNPCSQLNAFAPGLQAALMARDSTGELHRKAGIMGVVTTSGDVCVGDEMVVELPREPHERLERV